MTLAETLRKACAANGLGVSGSADDLLARLFRGAKNAKGTKNKKDKKATSTSAKKAKAAKPKAKPKAKAKKTCVGGACKKPKGAIKKRPAFKATKAGGMRLSAASYFYDMCDGKISRCIPQPIQQPDGSIKLKKIRIVQGAHGKQPRWVLA